VAEAPWVDLCDPDEATLRAALPAGVHDVTIARMLRGARDNEPRARLEARGSYVFGVLAFPVLTDSTGAVLQEIDVIARHPRHVPDRAQDTRRTARVRRRRDPDRGAARE